MKPDTIVMMPVKDIKPYYNNPRTHDNISEIKESIRRVGFRGSIWVDKDNVIIAGHGRYMAAKELGMDEVPVSVMDDLSDAEVKYLRIKDNRASDQSEWDYEAYQAELDTLRAMDYDVSDIEYGDDEGLIEYEEPPEVSEDEFDEDKDVNDHGVKPGDVWQLGDHRLMCGDSTDHGQVEILMDGNLADIVFTDPPWNVAYGERDNPKWKTRTILNDSMSTEDFKEFMGKAFESMKRAIRGGGIVYVVMSAQEWGNLMLVLRDKGMHWSSTIIWAKDSLILSRKDYHTQYEPIWYGWEGSKPRVCEVEDRTQSDLWEIQRPKRSDEHPTMKPVELVARALLNSSKKGDAVLDLFGGSGTTMIAAEQTGRKCRMMELDPHYCDVILSRWEQFTGQTAVKVDG